jgi:hypothetical protein
MRIMSEADLLTRLVALILAGAILLGMWMTMGLMVIVWQMLA